jgi:hypothetical protein
VFSLLSLTIPGQASANSGSPPPPTIQQIGYYQPAYYSGHWHHHPYACRYRRYRHRHPYACR